MTKYIKDKIDWLLKYCSEYPGHEFMYDERLDDKSVFNIDLGIEKYILRKESDINFVLLTGDAGDGKSRVLNNLRNSLISWEFINDFSEFNSNKQIECLDNIFDAINNKTNKYIVAGNSGIFMNAVVKYKYELIEKLKNREKCLVINFKNRNLAESKEKFSLIIKEFLKYEDFKKCSNCTLEHNCPFIYNLEKMTMESIIDRIRILFDALFLKGIHVTLRDLLSSISYFVTSGVDCDQIISSNENTKWYFYNNVFCYQGSSNMILKELAEIDIANLDIEEFDYKFFSDDYNLKEFSNDFTKLSKLELLKMVKRYNYFVEPQKLSKSEDVYSLLPIDFISEYKKIIEKIKTNQFIDSMDDSNKILQKFELGLNKISNPNRSNAQLVLFDSPPITSKDVRLEYISGQIRLIFCSPRFFFTNGNENCSNNEDYSYEDLNSFNCFVYNEEETFEKCPAIKIDYSIFSQILLAESNIFTDKTAKLSDNVHIQSFTKAIFDNISIDYGVNVIWTRFKNENTIDFKMSFVKPTALKKDRKYKVSISCIG